MKGRTGFILFIAIFLLLIYWVEVSKPKSFDWRVTYKPESGEPFGCKLFDEMMSKTMPKGYKVTSRDLQSLALDSTEMGNNNILLLSEDNALHSSFSERLDAIGSEIAVYRERVRAEGVDFFSADVGSAEVRRGVSLHCCADVVALAVGYDEHSL